MNKILLPALAIVAFVAPASQAQTFSRFDRSFDVNGTLQTPEGRRDIRTITVDLNADGTAALRLSGRGNGYWNNIGSDINFSGRWSANTREVTINLDQASGRNIYGTATLRFDTAFDNDRDDRRGHGGWNGNGGVWNGGGIGNGRNSERFGRRRPRLEQISISGRLGNTRLNAPTFSGIFDIQDRQDDDYQGGNYRGGITDLFTTKRGFGTVRINNSQTENVRSAKVELDRNGEAKITLEGNQTWFFEGSWRQTSRDRIALSLDSSASAPSVRRVPSFPSDTGLGSGEIVLDGLSFESLTLSGRRGNQGFDVSFSGREGQNNGNESIVERSTGRGVYKSERGKRKLTAMNIRLRRNQEARVRFDGEGKEIVLDGRWTRSFNGDYVANLKGGPNGDIVGVATIKVSGGDVTDFNFVGRDRSGRCTISFDS